MMHSSMDAGTLVLDGQAPSARRLDDDIDSCGCHRGHVKVHNSL